MAGVLFLALRPHLVGARRIVLVRLEKVEAAAGCRPVRDGDAELLQAGFDRRTQRAAVVTPHRRLAVDRQVTHLEGHGVEHELVGAGIDAAHVERGPRADALFGHVERHLQTEVLDGEWPVPLEVVRAAGKGEWARGSSDVLVGAYGRATAPRVQAMLDGHGAESELHTTRRGNGRGFLG